MLPDLPPAVAPDSAVAPTRPRSLDLGMLGGVTQLLFAVLLGVFLTAVTDSTGDAVPRPVVLTLLYAAPGLVALLGAASRRRSLLVVAALPLIPGSVLSFAGVTLIFILPVLLMVAGVASLSGNPSRPGTGIRAGGVAVAVAIAALLVAAGWAMLLGFTGEGCTSGPDGTSCGTGLITIAGVVVGIVLQLVALALAAWWARQARPPTA